MSKTFNDTGMGRIIAWISAHVFKKSEAVTTQVLGIDSAPTNNSSNLVTSGGVYNALNNLNNKLSNIEDTVEEIDTTPIENSTKPVSSGGVYDAISEVEEVTATSLINLNDRVSSLENRSDVFCFDVVIDTSTLNNNTVTGTSSATYTEICSEIDAGKAIIAKINLDVNYYINLSSKGSNMLLFILTAETESLILTINSSNNVTLTMSNLNLSLKEDKSNKVTSISSSSSDYEYPSAKCVYDEISGLSSVYAQINGDYTEPFSVSQLNLASGGNGNNTTIGNWPNGDLTLSNDKHLIVTYTKTIQPLGQSDPFPNTITKTVAYTEDIPSAVTESTVTGWGFTKNTGTYSKPSTGIPASDLASGVIPTVPTISVNIQTDKASDVKTASPKAVYDEVHPAVASTQPQGGFLPNIFYKLGTITGSVTFALASPTDNTIVNHYFWTFETSTTAPTITWPSGISWIGGSAPTISASCHYEISILDNVGVYMEV